MFRPFILAAAIMLLLKCAGGFPTKAHAGEVPRPSKTDPRVTRIVYGPEKVVQLLGQYGMSTLVVLHPGDQIKAFTGGYLDAWKLNNLGNKFTVGLAKPDANTNLSVVVERADGGERTYHFELLIDPRTAGKPTRFGVPMQVTFEFPQDRVVAQQRTNMELDLRRGRGTYNTKYSAQGADSLRPRAAWDDGTFTYLLFHGQTDRPAVFAVDDYGNESLVNTHRPDQNDHDLIALHKIGRQFVLRRGPDVVCIYNEGPIDRSPSISTGTTSPAVRRTVR